MTSKDKLLALLAKAEELEAKATPGPLAVHHRMGVSYLAANTKIADVYSTAFKDQSNQEANANIFALSRNSFLPVLRLLVERLDECSRCCGTGVSLDKGYGFCPSCTPRYAALCEELEKLGVIFE